MTVELQKMESLIKLLYVIAIAGATALGVKVADPGAAKPDDVSAAVRAELSPVKAQLGELVNAQARQDLRLQVVEIKLAAVASATATND